MALDTREKLEEYMADRAEWRAQARSKLIALAKYVFPVVLLSDVLAGALTATLDQSMRSYSAWSKVTIWWGLVVVASLVVAWAILTTEADFHSPLEGALHPRRDDEDRREAEPIRRNRGLQR